MLNVSPNWCWLPGAGSPHSTKSSATCLVSSPILTIFSKQKYFSLLFTCCWRDHDQICQSKAFKRSHALAWLTSQLTSLHFVHSYITILNFYCVTIFWIRRSVRRQSWRLCYIIISSLIVWMCDRLFQFTQITEKTADSKVIKKLYKKL